MPAVSSKLTRTMRRHHSILWFALILASIAGTAGLLWPPTDSEQSATHWPLRIISSNETHHFSVELALSQEARRAGLMLREHLDKDSGMLFVYDRPQVQSMWMKNTLLSLDMLFLDAEGVIQRIVRNTTPRSTQQILGPPDSLYVLELRGGVTRKLNIRPQDRVENLPQPGYSPSSP